MAPRNSVNSAERMRQVAPGCHGAPIIAYIENDILRRGCARAAHWEERVMTQWWANDLHKLKDERIKGRHGPSEQSLIPETKMQVVAWFHSSREVTVKRYHRDSLRPAPQAPPRLDRRLQCRAPGSSSWPEPLRLHLHMLDFRAGFVPQSNPSNAGPE
jgi:hypothetical protein